MISYSVLEASVRLDQFWWLKPSTTGLEWLFDERPVSLDTANTKSNFFQQLVYRSLGSEDSKQHLFQKTNSKGTRNLSRKMIQRSSMHYLNNPDALEYLQSRLTLIAFVVMNTFIALNALIQI